MLTCPGTSGLHGPRIGALCRRHGTLLLRSLLFVQYRWHDTWQHWLCIKRGSATGFVMRSLFWGQGGLFERGRMQPACHLQLLPCMVVSKQSVAPHLCGHIISSICPCGLPFLECGARCCSAAWQRCQGSNHPFVMSERYTIMCMAATPMQPATPPAWRATAPGLSTAAVWLLQPHVA